MPDLTDTTPGISVRCNHRDGRVYLVFAADDMSNGVTVDMSPENAGQLAAYLLHTASEAQKDDVQGNLLGRQVVRSLAQLRMHGVGVELVTRREELQRTRGGSLENELTRGRPGRPLPLCERCGKRPATSYAGEGCGAPRVCNDCLTGAKV